MPATVIYHLRDTFLTQDRARIIQEMREIFFESSARQVFSSLPEKEDFYQKYLGFYLDHYQDLTWVALNDEKKCLGYLVGAKSTEEFLPLQPHLEVFAQELQKYPAHLHMNCHKDYRAQGLGQLLLHAFETKMKTDAVVGFHIVTSSDSDNRWFYLKQGLNQEIQSGHLLFMGKGCI